MRNLQFNGWQRVSKAYFQKAYLNGERVCVAPCNVNLDSFWYGGNGFVPHLYKEYVEEYNYYSSGSALFPKAKNMTLNDYILTELEKWLNDVKYFNCNRELGTYLAYYVAR